MCSAVKPSCPMYRSPSSRSSRALFPVTLGTGTGSASGLSSELSQVESGLTKAIIS